MLQMSGEGRPSQLRTASISCFLTLSQLEVKLDIRVSQFLEDVISNVERTSSHLTSAASRSSSMKQKKNILSQCASLGPFTTINEANFSTHDHNLAPLLFNANYTVISTTSLQHRLRPRNMEKEM